MITPAHLRARRALHKAAGLKLSRRKKMPTGNPTRARLRYQKYLTSLRKDLLAAIKEELLPLLPDIVAQANRERGRKDARFDASSDSIKSIFEKLRIRILRQHTPIGQEEILGGVFGDTDLISRTVFAGQTETTAALRDGLEGHRYHVSG